MKFERFDVFITLNGIILRNRKQCSIYYARDYPIYM